MKNAKLGIILTFLITFFAVFLTATVGWCFGVESDVRNIVLKDGDIPNFKLTDTAVMGNSWPIVTKLPEYMRHPEDQSSQVNPLSSATNSLDVLSLNAEVSFTKKDAFRQTWKNSQDNWINIDYGYYNTPQQALDAIYYVVYQRTRAGAGFQSSLYYPYNSNNNQFYGSQFYTPVCRKISAGDVGYFVGASNGSGGFIYFVRKNYIFMVDSLQQSVEDYTVGALLNRIK